MNLSKLMNHKMTYGFCSSWTIIEVNQRCEHIHGQTNNRNQIRGQPHGHQAHHKIPPEKPYHLISKPFQKKHICLQIWSSFVDLLPFFRQIDHMELITDVNKLSNNFLTMVEAWHRLWKDWPNCICVVATFEFELVSALDHCTFSILQIIHQIKCRCLFFGGLEKWWYLRRLGNYCVLHQQKISDIQCCELSELFLNLSCQRIFSK